VGGGPVVGLTDCCLWWVEWCRFQAARDAERALTAEDREDFSDMVADVSDSDTMTQ